MVREIGSCFVLLWKSVLISMGLNIFICYKRGMVKIYKFIFVRSTWGNHTKKLDGNLKLRLIRLLSENYINLIILI